MKKKVRGLLINFAVLGITVLVMLVFLEIILRITVSDPSPGTKYHDTYVYTFNSGEREFFSPDHNRSFVREYNELGWYGPLNEYALKTNKTYRILVIGDSFSSQLNLESYDDIFSEQLEDMYEDVDVVTIGVGSYAFDNEYKVMEIEGEKYDPDMVILATFINDVMDTYRDNVFSLQEGALVDNTPRMIPFSRMIIFHCQDKSYVCSLFIKNTFERFSIQVNKLLTKLGISDIKRDATLEYRLWGLPDALFKDGEQPASVAMSYEKSSLIMERMKDLAETRGYEFAVMMIPIKEQISERKAEEFFEREGVSGFDFAKPYQDIKLLLAKQSITVVDLAPVFLEMNVDNEFYFEIDGHWNTKGHTLAAQELKRYVDGVREEYYTFE